MKRPYCIRRLPALIAFLFVVNAMPARAVTTNYINFSATVVGSPGGQAGPADPANGPSSFDGSTLNVGDQVVVDALVVDLAPDTNAAWAGVELNALWWNPNIGMFDVLTAAAGTNQLWIGTRPGTNATPFTIGTGTSTTNRVRITLTATVPNSTAMMDWTVQIDPGLTGNFTSTLSSSDAGTPADFTAFNDVISLNFGASQHPYLFSQYNPPTSPMILRQPQSLTVNEGQMATFSVFATGTAPLGYQWQFNGTNLAGSTNNVLALAAADYTNAGNYSVLVANPSGVVTGQVAVLTVQSPSVTVDAQNPGWVRGQLIVQFNATVGQSLLQALATNMPFSQLPFPADVQTLNLQYSAQSLVQAHPGVGTNDQGLEYIFLMQINPQANAQQAAADYATSPEVTFAEPNYIGQFSSFPDDVNYSQQWALPLINAPTAWNVANGSGVVVAVVDTGVDVTHCDLAANCVAGWDILAKSASMTDTYGHGTHVAGIIAAIANNTEGTAGLAYGAEIMPVRVAMGGTLTLNDGANGIIWAVAHGAKVINCSWGGDVPGGDPNLDAAVNYAHANNVLVVCAAGNSTELTRNAAPANCENAMAVSATDPGDNLTVYSNFGVKTDVTAPGGSGSTSALGILSTVPQTSFLHQYEGIATISAGGSGPCSGNLDMVLSGTSMASPHVAALAAMLFQLHPTWLPEEVKQTIRHSVKQLGNDAANGFDSHYGYGRINAAAAVLDNEEWPIASLTQPRNGTLVQSPTAVIGESGGFNFGSYRVDIAPGVDPAPSSFATLWIGSSPVNNASLGPTLGIFANGTYTLRVVTTSASGLTSEDRNEIQFRGAYIASPGTGNPCPACLASGIIPITGVAPEFMTHIVNQVETVETFQSYTLSYVVNGGPAVTFVNGTSPVNSVGLLGDWNTATAPNGLVTLQLIVNYTGGLVVQDSVVVQVDKLLKPGWPVAVNSSPSMKSPMAADLDGNGVKSIIYGASVFNSDGTIRAGWDANPGLGRCNPAVVDVNNDGIPEIIAPVFTSYYPPDPTAPNNGGVVIYCYPASGKAHPLWTYNVTNPNYPGYPNAVPSSISVGDVDGDGKPEVVFTVYYLYGGTTELFVLDAATGVLKYQTAIPGICWSSVALANLDSDPALDMVVTSSTETTVLKVVGGSLVDMPGSQWPQPVGDADADPVVADVDHDGKYEILVDQNLWRADGTSFPGAWPSIYYSYGTGCYAPPAGNAGCDLNIVLSAANEVPADLVSDAGVFLGSLWQGSENLYIFGADENYTCGVPIVADITGDDTPEILRPSHMGFTSSNFAYLYDTYLASSQFPRAVCDPDKILYSSALVDDVDGDGQTDVLIASGGEIYFWKLGKNHLLNSESRPWPMFQHDLAHTGTLPIGGDGAYDLFIEDTPYNYTGAPDTGLEPDPNMAGLDMWLSRSIWVHNDCSAPAGDYTTAQNPIAGQDNCVFTMVSNRGCLGVPNAVVTLYYADASTGLSWPASWTEIGSTTIPFFAPHSSTIVNVTWNPPGTGHYCLLAIVSSPLDPLVVNTSDLNAFVRDNNNVAWRNVNVVGSPGTGGGSNHSQFNMQNLAPTTESISLQFTADRNFLTTGGQATVDLGALAVRWQTNGSQGVNLTNAGGTTVALLGSPASIDGLVMAGNEQATLGLTLSTTNPMPVPGLDQTYNFFVRQIVNGTAVGGIAYIVQTAGQDTNGIIGAALVGVTNNGFSSLQLSWPANHLGWQLQVNTNALNSTNWQAVGGSTGTNQMALPINPTVGNAFYRLVYPPAP